MTATYSQEWDDAYLYKCPKCKMDYAFLEKDELDYPPKQLTCDGCGHRFSYILSNRKKKRRKHHDKEE